MSRSKDSKRRPRGARDILLTGFPSFMPHRMLRTIFTNEPDSFVRLLVRPDFIDRATRRLEAMGADPDRYQILSGDVVSLDLGLSGTEYLELLANVTDIYHIASIWYLGASKREIQRVNVEGARNIVDAALEMEHLKRLNHYSTAFVAGQRSGVIMEDELDEGQSFRNAYERTKYEAELIMRQAMDLIPVSIYRPSIVVGDSQTGEIDRMAGPYFLMNLIVQMPESFPILMPGKGDKPLNLVPADYVCEAMHRISLQDDSIGKTFHLCDTNPLSARKVFELIAHTAGKRPPVGHLPYSLTKWAMKIPYVEKFTRGPRQFAEDFNHLTIYNSINAVDALKGDLRCPPFPSYAENLVAFIKTTGMDFDVELPTAEELLG
ncbi:SDR family oxidoreductase [Bradymonas sediminis]|uniref:Epimerase n=1 Tax=Bradymonas sediminis TaxID=1548548 RepID=A0A2Z4FKI2_9DELT|nr:SDR family oxidoreductase [Bradymonas sediminis]AWV89208.1 epimerase [Bradymonas sediminis]TDP73375.1 thioester reductase-like protein [Bradymonas sediminis]